MSKSPRLVPRYSAICSPHQSKSFSKGTIERKHTNSGIRAPSVKDQRVLRIAHTPKSRFVTPLSDMGNPSKRNENYHNVQV